MTPPPDDAVAALAEALHKSCEAGWERRAANGAGAITMHGVDAHRETATIMVPALTAAGWSLSHDSEQRSAVIGSERSDNEALVAALDRERVLRDLLSPAERPGAGYPCRRCGRRDMGHEPSCWYTRVDAAIEGRP